MALIQSVTEKWLPTELFFHMRILIYSMSPKKIQREDVAAFSFGLDKYLQEYA